MKNYLATMLLSAVAVTPGPVVANPINVSTFLACPGTNFSNNVITNFGSYIAGYGEQSFLSTTIPIYFKSEHCIGDAPRSLINYTNFSTSYDSVTGTVTCSYQSSIVSEPLLTVAYTITNGKGGIITSQAPNGISLLIPIGSAA